MSLKVSIRASLNWRALLVIAALTCLCVSSNVGPQLLPLPTATSNVAPIQFHQWNSPFYAPQTDAKSFRVPMMVQAKKRADKEPPHSDPLIALPSSRFGLSADTRFPAQIAYTPCFFTTITMAPRAGRAPPSLV